MYDYFSSYSSDRNIVIRVSSSYGDPLILRRGVPHGSILGPLLLLIYIDSIFNLKLKGNITDFADDLNVAYHSTNTLT